LDWWFTSIEIYLSEMTARFPAFGVLRAVKALHEPVDGGPSGAALTITRVVGCAERDPAA